MIFDDKRMAHSIAVAIKLKQLSQKLSDKKEYAEDMFYLGLLHDAGYEFSNIQEEHEQRGGEILKRNGYKYWREVYYHGNPNPPISSPELFLLNYADMTTGPNGETMTLEERVSEIAQRYGEATSQYKTALLIAKQLQTHPLYTLLITEQFKP